MFFFSSGLLEDLFPGLAFSSDVLAKFGLSNRPLSVFFSSGLLEDLFPGLAFSSDVLAKFGLSNRPLSVVLFFFFFFFSGFLSKS